MTTDIIHIDDPRYEGIRQEQIALSLERAARELRQAEARGRNKHNRLIASISRTWRDMDSCSHRSTRVERRIQLSEKDDGVHMVRCTRCRRAVGVQE